MASSSLPKRLKEARLRAGLSQKELGIRAGIDESSASPRMNQYEKGKHTPDYLMLKRLAEALDVPAAYFYADDDDLAEVIVRYGTASADTKKKIYEILGGGKS